MRASNAANGALTGVLAALPPVLAFRGFTVDDALVSARVATHLASGQGYRFNVPGPVVDAVTPLGWAELLASFGPAPVLGMFERARVIGTCAWLVGAALLGILVGQGRRSRAVLIASLVLSAPLGAWASSGMETGVVTLLATLALVGGPLGAFCAGVAAALRPELLAWASVLTAGAALLVGESSRERTRALVGRLPLALGPGVAVACLRKARFGSFAPLAVWAKPSDFAHGVYYAAAAFVGGGVPLLCLLLGVTARRDGRARVLLAAVLAHFGALVLVGGDWMVLYRLAVPVLPTALLAAARMADVSTSGALVVRGALAALAPVWMAVTVAWPGRLVLAHRLALIAAARPLLRPAHSIACLDVGWVGAATDANLVDLAGITDPVVARLSGGHTSKKIPEGLLENRAVDAAVLLLAPGVAPAPNWQDAPFARAVEARVARLPPVEAFRLHAALPLGGTNQRYVVLAR
jgi:hypothetical protein